MPKSKKEMTTEKNEAKDKYVRPTWDEYFMEVMEAVAKRSTCDRGRSGCVIVKDKQILVTGYVGSAAGDEHCDDVGHQYQKRIHDDGSITEHCVRTIHAEQNAICQAAKKGISIDGAIVYQRMTPCPVCVRMYVNSGIKKVVCQRRYHDGAEAERLCKKCDIELVYLSDELQQYSRM